MLCKLDNYLRSLYRLSGYIAAFFLILVAIFILTGFASRIFGFYIRGLAEYSGYSMAASSFLALAYTFGEKGHIRITLFLEKFKENIKRILNLWCLFVTTFFINDRIDTGDVIGQSKIDINKNENAGELHNSLMRLGADLLIKSIDKIFSSKENISTKQLEVKNLKAAPKLNKTNCKINWQDSCINIHNKIRGLSPYPGARSVLDNLNKKIKVIVYKSDYIKEVHNHNSGSIYIEKDKIKIAVADGYIYPLLIKFEGKKTMDTKSLINGFNFNKECKMI